MDLTASVILPAAGIGERSKLDIPKQFCKIFGKPLICHTLSNFIDLPWIQHIIIPVAADRLDYMKDIVKEHKYSNVHVIIGGEYRHNSIYNGVRYLKEFSSTSSCLPDVILIHDAVRPVLNSSLLYRVAKLAYQHGASGVVCRLVSTVVQTDETGFLENSLDREKYRASEMPQGFRFHTICDAYDKCSVHDLQHGTECLDLVLKYAHIKAKLLETSDLWKVTYERDFFALEGILQQQQRHLLTFLIQSVVFTSEQQHMLSRLTTELRAQSVLCVDTSRFQGFKPPLLSRYNCTIILCDVHAEIDTLSLFHSALREALKLYNKERALTSWIIPVFSVPIQQPEHNMLNSGNNFCFHKLVDTTHGCTSVLHDYGARACSFLISPNTTDAISRMVKMMMGFLQADDTTFNGQSLIIQ